MHFSGKRHSLEGRPVKRQIGVFLSALMLTVAGFAAVVGLWRLITHLLLTYLPNLMQNPGEAAFFVFVALTILMAALGASLTALHPIHRSPRGTHGMHFH